MGLRNNKELNDIALSIYNNQGVLSSVCHGAAGLLDIKENGDYLVRHKDVTGLQIVKNKQMVQLNTCHIY